jgi:ABC-type nitrate/sulfonate/bicarbonate transport system permease component
MKRKWKAWRIVSSFVVAFLLSLHLAVMAAEKEVGVLPQKISVDNLSGISFWLAGLYNDERLYYSLLVTLIMGVVGLSIGFVTDLILKIFGLDVSKITHHE